MERCEQCGDHLIWQSDYEFSDLGIEGDGIVSVWLCDGCDDYTERHFSIEDEEDEG